jgi:predicted nucleic acid-binding protein
VGERFTDSERIFLDTNVLVYASVREAPGHAAARGFVEDCLARGVILVISRQVLREYLAVLSRPQTFALPIPRETLLVWVHAWCDRYEVLDDTAAVTETLLRLFAEVPFGGK